MYAHAHNYMYLSTLGLAHVSLDPRPCDSFRVTENGAGLGTRLPAHSEKGLVGGLGLR